MADRRCVRCERLLYPWHPPDKVLCTTCSPHREVPRVPQFRCCDCWAATDGDSRCPACKKRLAARRKQRTQQYALEGRCTRCGKEALPALRMCSGCRSYSLQRFDRFRNARCCLTCGKQLVAQDESFQNCLVCRIRHRRVARELYELRIAQGMCARCGKRPPVRHLTSCQACADAWAKKYADKKARKGSRAP